MALIKLSKSSLDKNEIFNVSKVLKKEFLGMGEEVFSFEKKFIMNPSFCYDSSSICMPFL